MKDILSRLLNLEEVVSYLYLLELEKKGIIYDIKYEPRSFVIIPKQTKNIEVKLKTKTKIIEKSVFREAKYTPDFSFMIHCGKQDLLREILPIDFNVNQKEVVIDVKPEYKNMKHSSTITFPDRQKLMFYNYGIYVHKFIPSKIFRSTFAPEDVFLGNLIAIKSKNKRSRFLSKEKFNNINTWLLKKEDTTQEKKS